MENLILGDCLEKMADIKPQSIDFILCDLPYQMTANSWDCMIPLDELWPHYKRLIKPNGAIALTAKTPFDKVLGCSNLSWLRYEWIWNKTKGTGFLNAKKAPLKSHENILIFYNKTPVYNPQMRTGFKPYVRNNSNKYNKNYGYEKLVTTINTSGDRYPLTILDFNYDKTKLHPTQKPVALFEYLIKTYTNEGDTVLDNCLGSGTTAIACINTNRNWIGIEKDPGYYQIALDRIQQHLLDKFPETT